MKSFTYTGLARTIIARQERQSKTEPVLLLRSDRRVRVGRIGIIPTLKCIFPNRTLIKQKNHVRDSTTHKKKGNDTKVRIKLSSECATLACSQRKNLRECNFAHIT